MVSTLRLHGHLRRDVLVSSAVVLALSLIAAVVGSAIAVRQDRTVAEAGMQAQATALVRTLDLQLRTYKAALETVAQSHALREAFDLAAVERDARRVGALYGGWFTIATGGDTLQVLMTTAAEDGRLPAAEPRGNYPELARAEAASLRKGGGAVSDAFPDRIKGELVVAIASAVDIPMTPAPFLYFSVTLGEITSWLKAADISERDFASLADGTRRVIARSRDNDGYLLAELPEWFIRFSEGRDSGVTVGPPVGGGEPRLFAMQRLTTAPDWTLAVSRPMPSAIAAVRDSAWPWLAALFTMLLGGGIAGLVLERRHSRIMAGRAARRAAERERLIEEIRAADARKARLIAVLAHDLRTPLVAVLGALDLLREDGDAEAQSRVLARVQRDGHGMLQLIDDVLELARLNAGELRLRPEPFAPGALLDEVAELVRTRAARHGTEVVTEAAGIPVLMGDVAALRRVLMNFATNAVKATRGGHIRLSVTAGAPGRDGRDVVFAVSDTGHGIAPEDLPRLFRDFGMLDRDDTAAEGTGLGLAICRRLATAMGGEVGVESTPGAGACFRFRLTLPEPAAEAPPPAPDAADATTALAGLRVLVAEDHDLIRQLTCLNLARCGARPVEAADGQEAVERAAAEAFDLILMDLHMPHLDGAAAAARIRREDGASARARIIGITAHQSASTAAMLSGMAMDACLAKPLDLLRLAALMGGQPAATARGDEPPLRPLPAGTMLDPDRLAELGELDGGALRARALAGLALEIDEVQAMLPERIDAGDIAGARRLAHKLAGACDVLGARPLAGKLHAFDRIAASAPPAALQKAVAALMPALTATRTAALASRSEAHPSEPERGNAVPAM